MDRHVASAEIAFGGFRLSSSRDDGKISAWRRKQYDIPASGVLT